MKKYLSVIFLLLACFQFSFAQEVKELEQPNDTTIYSVYIIDKQPQFPGGMDKFMLFLNKNMQYPVEAHNAGIEGKVYVRFVVEKDGSITNINVRKGVDPNIDAEAVRVISLMPNWEPGVKNGKIVRCKNEVPLTFKITK